MSSTVEVLVDAFQSAGTPFIAGHPGGESVELMDAARRADMRFILLKQESAAAMMAATWGEITGSPGVCISTNGPGAANMANGIAHAWMDRCPLFAVTGQYSGPVYKTGLRQRIDQNALFGSITKHTMTIDARTVRQQIRRAMRHATAHPPGPVQIDLPDDQSLAEAGDVLAEGPLMPNRARVVPDRDALKPALDMLADARHPVLIVGLGVLWCDAAAGLVALAERLGAPVLTTAKCKGAIPADHPLAAGCAIGGLIERTLVAGADLIVTVGLDAVELAPKPWPYRTPVLSLASVANLDGIVPAAHEVIGDLKTMLGRIAGWAGEGADWGEAAARAYRDSVVAALDTPSNGLSPQRVLEVARTVLPRDTVATCDAGASRILVVQKWHSHAPREFMTSNGLASMGYAIPSALAARLAYPGRPVVAFVGDGGFLMAVAELQTASRDNLPIIVVIFDDAEIGLIRVKQQIKGIEPFGIGLGGLDWEKIAQGFGCDGVVVETEKALGDAFAAALASGRTTVIAARIDGSGYLTQFNALREI